MRMIYSAIVAVLVVGVAIFLGMRQADERAGLEEEWRVLEEKGFEYRIPADPDEAYALGKTRVRSSRVVRTGDVSEYAERFIGFFKGMRERNRSHFEDQKEMYEMVDEMLDFSTGEMEMLVDIVLADESLDEGVKREMVGMTLLVLSNEQPELALTLVLKTKDVFDTRHQHMVGVALGQLAKVDPSMALQWMDDHGEEVGGITDELRMEVIASASIKDVKMAMALVEEMKFEDRSRAMMKIAKGVTVETADGFLAGVRAMSEEAVKETQVLRALGSSAMIADFDGVTGWLEKAELSEVERSSFLKGLQVNRLIDEDQDGSVGKWMDWLAEQSGSVSQSISGQLLSEWTREDFRSAGEWINTLKLGRRRDLAALNYAETLARHEPAAAVPWAETLPDGAARQRVIRVIHGKLMEKDPASASALAKKYRLVE